MDQNITLTANSLLRDLLQWDRILCPLSDNTQGLLFMAQAQGCSQLATNATTDHDGNSENTSHILHQGCKGAPSPALVRPTQGLRQHPRSAVHGSRSGMFTVGNKCHYRSWRQLWEHLPYPAAGLQSCPITCFGMAHPRAKTTPKACCSWLKLRNVHNWQQMPPQTMAAPLRTPPISCSRASKMLHHLPWYGPPKGQEWFYVLWTRFTEISFTELCNHHGSQLQHLQEKSVPFNCHLLHSTTTALNSANLLTIFTTSYYTECLISMQSHKVGFTSFNGWSQI